MNPTNSFSPSDGPDPLWAILVQKEWMVRAISGVPVVEVGETQGSVLQRRSLERGAIQYLSPGQRRHDGVQGGRK